MHEAVSTEPALELRDGISAGSHEIKLVNGYHLWLDSIGAAAL